jgi:spermidine synthase
VRGTTPRVVVRPVKGGIELRVDGTLASFRSTSGASTGTVWWTLAAPVLLLPRARPRVLLLGLGAGSVAAAVRALAPSAAIVGVERDREVLRAARTHFDLDRHRVEVVADDAFDYLRRARRRFDLVVEDLFVGSVRRVRKPEGLLDEGYRLIRGCLADGGLAVANTIHETPAVVRAMRPLGPRVVSMNVRGHWNRVVLGGRDVPPARALRALLAAHPALSAVLPRLSVRGWPG